MTYKKKTKAAIIIIGMLLLICCLIGSASAFSGGGSGTEGNPYQITTSAQLQEMNDDLSAYYKLMNDINCSSLSNWTPIGTTSTPFTGHLDGNNKTIKNLTFNTNGANSGIFGTMSNGASINDCIFDNINHTSTNQYTGIICGCITSASSSVVMTNVTLQNSKHSAENNSVGGFVGSVKSSSTLTCTNCVCKNTTVSTGVKFVGGFVGSVNSSSMFTCNGCIVDNCKVESTGSNYAGGFVGYANSSSLVFDSSCICKNTTVSAGSEYVGGFVGYISSSSSTIKISEGASVGSGAKVTNCCIFIEGVNYVGGFIGYTSAGICKIDGCIVSNCTLKGNSRTAGISSFVSKTDNVTISEPSVKNCTITATSGRSSGIVSYFGTTTTISIFNGSIENTNIYGNSYTDVAASGTWSGTTTNGITHTANTYIKTDSTGISSFSASTNKVTFQITVGGVNGYEGSTHLTTGNPFSWSHTDGTHTYTDTVALDSTGKATIDWTGREYGIYTSTLTITNELGNTTVTFSNIPIYLPLTINVSSSASKIQPSSELKLSCSASGGLGTTTYEWEQGTTVISTEQNPTITVPEEEGTYTYSVTVTNASTSQTKTGEVTVKVTKVWNDTERTVTENTTASFILVMLIPLALAGILVLGIVRTGKADPKTIVLIGVLIVVTILIVILAGSIDGTVIEGMEKLR